MKVWIQISVLVLLLCLPVTGLSQISREQALAAVYPGAEIRAERIFLADAQLKQAREAAGMDVTSGLIARYLAVRSGTVVGRAYVDTHVVRTKRESLLICLDPAGKVKRIEVTAFLEPPEYQAPRAWYDQYYGKSLDNDLRLHRAIRPIAGASLTAQATADAVRRVMAIDRVLGMQEGNKQ
jgi:hypothetical protein